MTIPKTIPAYLVPEFDSRFESDVALIGRCEEVACEIYETLKPEVEFLRKLPSDCLTSTVWDWCQCTAWLMQTIESSESDLGSSCTRESAILYRLAWHFLRYGIATEANARKLKLLLEYVSIGMGNSSRRRVS